MAFNRLGTFTLGVIITAVSVGAVNYANAAGDATLKACANKTSGAMRYISKGSCKKTEKSLSWNQMGPSGMSGMSGTKGDTGASGTNGTNGTNGQNYSAVDATGKTLGPITGSSFGSYDVLIEGKIWNLTSAYVGYNTSSQGTASTWYSNNSCTTPYFVIDNEMPPRTFSSTNNLQGVAIDTGRLGYSFSRLDAGFKAYQPTGTALSWTASTTYMWEYDPGTDGYVCSLRPSGLNVIDSINNALYAAVEVTRPTYTAPLTLVAK